MANYEKGEDPASLRRKIAAAEARQKSGAGPGKGGQRDSDLDSLRSSLDIAETNRSAPIRKATTDRKAARARVATRKAIVRKATRR